MKCILSFLFLITLYSCSRLINQDGFKRFEKSHIQIGCKIFDINGTLLRSYAGNFCSFEKNGDVLIYFSNNLSLVKYDKNMKIIWKINQIHVHHGFKKDLSGNYIVMSSERHPYLGYQYVRFDKILLISDKGEIVKTFSFFKEKDLILKTFALRKFLPQFRPWDRSLQFSFEFSHLNSVYQYDGAFEDQEDSKNGFILTMLQPSPGMLLLDDKLEKITRIIDPEFNSVHDAQYFSNSEIIFFKNSNYRYFMNKKMKSWQNWQAEEAEVLIYDIIHNRVTANYGKDLKASIGGNVQVIDKKYALITDLGSPMPKKAPEFFHGRTILLELKSGKTKTINFNIMPFDPKITNLDFFLAANVGM